MTTNNQQDDKMRELSPEEHAKCHAIWREQREALVDTGHDYTQLALAHDMFFKGYVAAVAQADKLTVGDAT